MALLQNEDFAIWYLRTSYLANVKDGVGERLINVNNAVLNTPAFRAAGWVVDPVQRTYSPPIPTAITAEYFQGINDTSKFSPNGDEEDEGGMVTGRPSNDTVGPGPNIRRRRRKEQMDEDDSSDLSDESDEEAEGAQRAAQQIRFAKMPARDRADSSPMRKTETKGGPDVVVISPSKRSTEGRLRSGSLNAVEAVKARARADTTTSSDLSSEADAADPAYFQRRHVNVRNLSKSNLLTDTLKQEVATGASTPARDQLHDDSDVDSVGSALSSELGETVESNTLLNTVDDRDLQSIVTSTQNRESMSESPRKTRTNLLQDLPPPRPISFIQPTSLLSMAFKAQKERKSNPVEKFATLSGKGITNPLWIKIYAPFSDNPETPFEMPLTKTSRDGESIIVAEAIGLALWSYGDQKKVPALTYAQLNVNKWTLRMVEDGEVDFDFPALVRTRPITDFTSNNNRGARGRSREKPFDEFALVEAGEAEFEANKRSTPAFSPTTRQDDAGVALESEPILATKPIPAALLAPPNSNQVLARPFPSALSNTTLEPADKPVSAGPQATPRLGVTKTLRVRFFDFDTSARTMTLEMSTDSYIAEVLDQVCKRWNFDKAGFVLKVAGTNTVAPLDRTVEALGTRSDLELARKRFGAGPAGLTGSPGSASPNAPLLLDIQGPRKMKKGEIHPLAQKQDIMSTASNFKKYYVTRKQLAGFGQGSQRVLVFDGDHMHLMPDESGKALFESKHKTTSIPFSDIIKTKVSTKHSRLVRVVVRRLTEDKRYDLEARTAGEAQEIVDDILREMKLARG